MRIQHNIPAMNSYRNFASNTKAVSKNLEKLSSGYRINRAGDDAAGLAISEKMRAQVTGLKTAQKNAKDGISLVQTAEGALTEVHSMLNRMVELADQSANGTYQDAVDRENLQKEVSALKTEIDRVADSTNFNGIKLLDGSLSTKASELADSAILKGTEKLDGLAKETINATKGKYEIKADLDSALTDGSTKWITAGGAGKQLDLTLTDTNGTDYTLSFTFDGTADVTTGGLRTALTGLLSGGIENAALDAGFKANNEKALSDLGKIFGSLKIEAGTATDEIKITAESKTEGAAGVGLKSFKLQERALDATGAVADPAANFTGNTALSTATSANTTVTATDKYINLKAGAGDLAAGKKITIGDHTFELKEADDFKTTEGNVRVTVGADDTETKKNLVAAMKNAGMSGVSLTADGNIKVADENQLKTADKSIEYNNMVDIKSASLGVKIDTVDQVNGSVKFTPGAPTDITTKQQLGIGYTDADGNVKSVQVEYTGAEATVGGGADAKATAKAMANAINTNDATKGLFKATVNDTTGEITLESLGGKDGAVVKTIASTDGAAGAAGTMTAGATAARAGQSIELTNSGIAKGDIVSIGGKEYQFLDQASSADPTNIKKGATVVLTGATDADTAKNLQTALANDGIEAELSGKKLTIRDGEKLGTENGGLTLQIGDTSDDFNQIKVSVNDMHTKGLGIDGIDISKQADAKAAVQVIKDAINSVSSTRGGLGAIQNRLDHTINNLSVMTENIQEAESNIRDTDMADEMMNYTKNNILVQAAQSMLAQANQSPQGVLQLLQ